MSVISLLNFFVTGVSEGISSVDLTVAAQRGATYPYYFNYCMCCGVPITANFRDQTGNVAFCNPCLSADWKCCKKEIKGLKKNER